MFTNGLPTSIMAGLNGLQQTLLQRQIGSAFKAFGHRFHHPFADDHIGGGGEIILGNKKNNTLYGDDAAETLRALGGKDKIFAGAGADTIEGGVGRDQLWGEAGSDIFKFGNKNGMDDIRDFSLSDGDRIDLSDVKAITSYADLIDNHFFTYQGDAYIKISNGNDILVVGVDAADLMSEGNFIF